MMKHSLVGSIRTVIGNQVSSLRKRGLLPGTVYGKDITPVNLELDSKIFEKTYKAAGETGLIELTVDGKIHPVLIKNVQFHPVTHAILHVEFHEVDLKEKIHANIPVELVGESPAIKEGIGTMLELIHEIEVEALPTNLPEHVEIHVDNLLAVNDQIQVKDISLAGDVTIITDPEVIIVKIGELTAPEPEPVATEVAPEGEAPAEGEATSEKEEAKEEEPKKE